MLHQSDQGNGTYRNPILYSDYSDPDAIRVGDDYYMISSSFSNAPAIPLLHSYDLVNWKVINYVCDRIPEYRYINPIHGSGVWAPAIRFHDGEFFVFFPMPDEGIYVTRTKDPKGKWDRPVRMMDEYGVIDPCPFWDDDGNAYLITAVAGSRKGYKSVLLLSRMSPDGMRILSDPVIIYDGRGTENETIEGPKLYKRNGYYYIFAPAGGVKAGFQVVLRSRDIFGPYEYRIVMHQGSSPVNGPHQGAWVDTVSGEDWFIHFQDVFAAGRIVHLQPMSWTDDWPVIGIPADGSVIGEPVMQYKKPAVRITSDIHEPDNSDDFDSDTLGLQWQWNANPEDGWYSLIPDKSVIRLFAVKTNRLRQLPDFRNLLLQKWPAPEFGCEIKMNVEGLSEGDMAGIVSMGQSFCALALRQTIKDEIPVFELVRINGSQEFDHQAAFAQSTETTVPLDGSILKATGYEVIFNCDVKIKEYRDYPDRTDAAGNTVWARHIPQEDITLSLMINGALIEGSSITINAQAGRWVGVKTGMFCIHKGDTSSCGFADVDHVMYNG